MATRITGGTLTVTITESLTMTHSTTADNRTHSQTITKTFSGIDQLNKRVLNLPNTNQVKVIDLGGTAASAPGTFLRSAVEYIRITNLDDTNGVTVILEDTGADTAAILVDADSSLLLTDTQIEAFTNGSAFSAFSDIDEIFLKAASANTQVEVVVATTA
tara:strand:- start:1041 stop:1520 length:480 start_codon:yes stop_codon:yes gene_type:complete